MKLINKLILMLVTQAIIASVQASGILMSDDLSTLDNFTSTPLTGTTGQWTANGTNAVYSTTDDATSSTARARLTSNPSFDLNPGGTKYQSVTLEFTTTASSFAGGGYRYEIGLVTENTVSAYNAAAFMGTANVEGIVLTQTGDYPLGLKVRTGGAAPGAATAAAIGMVGMTGTHDYKIVFTATGTELFRDGVSLGTTPSALDFSKDYKVVAWGQGFNLSLHTRSLDNVLLMVPAPKTLRLLLISGLCDSSSQRSWSPMPLDTEESGRRAPRPRGPRSPQVALQNHPENKTENLIASLKSRILFAQPIEQQLIANK